MGTSSPNWLGNPPLVEGQTPQHREAVTHPGMPRCLGSAMQCHSNKWVIALANWSSHSPGLENMGKSALADRGWQTGHPIQFTEAKVLYHSLVWNMRMIREALEIQTTLGVLPMVS